MINVKLINLQHLIALSLYFFILPVKGYVKMNLDETSVLSTRPYVNEIDFILSYFRHQLSSNGGHLPQ